MPKDWGEKEIEAQTYIRYEPNAIQVIAELWIVECDEVSKHSQVLCHTQQ